MRIVVARSRRPSLVGADVLPAAVAAAGTDVSHALVLGGSIAICGTPAAAGPASPDWPAASGRRCPACERLLATYTR